MRLVRDLMGPIVSAEFNKTFDIFIQIGAIAAVVVYFRHKILDLLGLKAPPPGSGVNALTGPQRKRTLLLILLASLPLLPAKYAAEWSEAFFAGHSAARLETLVIAGALGAGGVLMILIEKFKPVAARQEMTDITPAQAVVIGCFQIVAAVIPGTSRSMATIMPALCMRISRPAAAEFSFFLAIPALVGAGLYKLAKWAKSADAGMFEAVLLALGSFVAFVVAYVVIAAFMGFIRRYTFTPFGVYRILLAAAVFLVVYL
jgi:undecaprenyl-diphosphatase